MNDKTLHILQYDKIIQMLCQMCVSQGGRSLAQNLRPSLDQNSIAKALGYTEQAEQYLFSVGSSPVQHFDDIEQSVARSMLGSSLSMAELLKIALFLQNLHKLKRALDKEVIPAESIYELAKGICDFRYIEDEILRCIISPDEMHDTASGALADIRRNIRKSNEKLREKLNGYLRNPEMAKLLQEPIITMRGDRYVLPVRCENKAAVQGIVHDQSSSGATLFIEPIAVVELNNELRLLAIKEKEEIERIIAELSKLVAGVGEDILNNYKLMCRFDLIFAKAKLSRSMNAITPLINNDGYINIKNGRHPLLDPQKVVPSNVWLGDKFNVLLITGPNTGGKTVTLKMIGLFQLMAQSGLNVPCDIGSKLSVFDGIYADIGDEQSIEQSLSTFSAHMTNIANIMNQATGRSLVLFDELGAGTDPNEGASLAIAILERLIKIGTRTVATTHYSELKAFSFSHDGIENASVEFDSVTLKPTYKLAVGIPGASNAFLISRRLGLSNSIIQRAEELMDGEQMRFESVLQKAQEHKRLAEEEMQKAEEIRLETERIRNETDRINKELKQKEDEIISKAHQAAKKILQNADKEAQKYINELKDLKDNCNDEALIKMQKMRKNMQEELVDKQTIQADDTRGSVKVSEIVPGLTVYVKSLAQSAIVRSAPNAKGEVRVQAGILQMDVKVSDVAQMETKQNKPISKVRINKGPSVVSMSIDVRGKTVDEAMLEIDRYLEEASYSGYKEVTIIHGKGTGALRAGIQQELKKHNKVKSQRMGRYGEGEMGVTVVELK